MKAAKKKSTVDEALDTVRKRANAARDAALMDARIFAAQLNGVLPGKIRGAIEALVVFSFYSGRTGTFDYRMLLGLAREHMKEVSPGAPADGKPGE